MKKCSLLVIIMIVVALMSACAPKSEKKVERLDAAVVDQKIVWEQSEEAEEYQERLNQRVEELKEEYDTETVDLSQSDKSAKQEEMYQEMNDLREELRAEFRDEIAKAVEKIATNEGYDIVLDKEEVRFGGTDITSDVLKELKK
ncbi:MAG: OmpH family outer membrane protein [Halanaerobacter sp.]